jgi:hypothetical protein
MSHNAILVVVGVSADLPVTTLQRMFPEHPLQIQQDASNSPFGRHPIGSATHRLMSDSLHPAPLTLILIWGGNVPSAILR